jgi:hypothetical protein
LRVSAPRLSGVVVMSDQDVIETLSATWRERALDIERFSPPAATAFRECAAGLERAVAAADHTILSLAEAAQESGYSCDHLRHLLAAGTIPNAGRKHKPRVRRADLPHRAPRPSRSGYDPAADALRLNFEPT